MLDMLSTQKQAFTFLYINQGDNNIKVFHLLDLLIEALGEEEGEKHHNNYLVFKEYWTKRFNLASLLFRKEWILPQKHKTKIVQAIQNHYTIPINPTIIKMDDKKDESQITQVIMVPTKWSRMFLLESCTPYNLINYLATIINDWEADMIKKMEYIRDWEIGACFEKNKTN